MLASIHDQLGLRRKAGFYRRRAALLYINGTNQTKSALSKVFTLLCLCYVLKKLLSRASCESNFSMFVGNDNVEASFSSLWSCYESECCGSN